MGAARSGNAKASPSRARAVLIARLYREFPSAPENPDEETGKFVVLARAGEVHLVLSPVGFTPYHADIVHRYLQVEGRGRVEAASSAGCRILSPEWAVHGGGHYAIEHWLRHIRLHGKSSAFGPYAEELLEPFADAIPERLDLKGYTLSLE